LEKTNNIDHNGKLLLRWLHHTKKFARDNPDILFTKADKGNATVALNFSKYKSKMIEIFSDIELEYLYDYKKRSN